MRGAWSGSIRTRPAGSPRWRRPSGRRASAWPALAERIQTLEPLLEALNAAMAAGQLDPAFSHNDWAFCHSPGRLTYDFPPVVQQSEQQLKAAKDSNPRIETELIELAGLEINGEVAAGIALIPLVLSPHEPGKEILHPVAVAICGGLISSTLLDLAVTPALFLLIGRKAAAQALRLEAPACQ